MTNTYKMGFSVFNLIMAVVSLMTATGIMFNICVIKLVYAVVNFIFKIVEEVMYRFIIVEVLIKSREI